MLGIPLESKDRLYSGPYVADMGGPADARWVWVASGIRPDGQMFDTPEPLRDRYEADTDPSLDNEAIVSGTADPWQHAAQDHPVTDGCADGDEGNGEDATYDGVDSAEPDAGTPRSVGAGRAAEVRVLGPVEVTGWRARPERGVVTELACFLALHSGRSIPGDELRAAFRPDEEQETSAKTLRTYMSLLRRALGPDLVPSGGGGGYRLSSAVTTDWHRFRALTGPTADTSTLREALSLVRGRPFAGISAGTFGWVYAELLVSDMEVAIADASRRLAEGAMATGDLDTAAWATRQGLAGVPVDVGLWQLHLAVARRQGPTFLERARRDAWAALGADAGDLIDDLARPPA